jgi:hypothetical protein
MKYILASALAALLLTPALASDPGQVPVRSQYKLRLPMGHGAAEGPLGYDTRYRECVSAYTARTSQTMELGLPPAPPPGHHGGEYLASPPGLSCPDEE